MSKSVLSLEIPDVMDSCVLRIVDLSQYDSHTGVKCPTLMITMPGFTRPVTIDSSLIVPGFTVNLTACDLGLQAEGCGQTYAALQDGIYIVRYSISPNDTVYVEYNHLRITSLLNKYYEVLCCLDMKGCNFENEEQEKINLLSRFRIYLDAAKSEVEWCHNPDRGMELYKYACEILKKINCKYCGKCK